MSLEQTGCIYDILVEFSFIICREIPQCPDKKPRDSRQGKVKCAPQKSTPGKGSGNAGETNSRSRNMLRRSQSMCRGTPVRILDIFRAPDAPEDTATSKKRKQGGASDDEENKQRNTSCELEVDEGRRRCSFSGTTSNSSTIAQKKMTSGLPIFSSKCKAGGAAPPGVVLGPNP